MSTEVVCPYCGHEHEDSWDFFLTAESDFTDIHCSACDLEFQAERITTVEYRTFHSAAAARRLAHDQRDT